MWPAPHAIRVIALREYILVLFSLRVCVSVCVRAYECVCAYVHACVRACVYVTMIERQRERL